MNRPSVFLLFPLLGAAGFALRALQLRTGFDGAGLSLPGANVPTAAAVCAILAAAALLSLRLPRSAPARAADTRPTAPKAALCAAAILTALMGILLLIQSGGKTDTLLALSALFTALFFLLALYPGAGQALHLFCRMEATLFYTVCLTVYFSRHISAPVLTSFYPALLALCAAALAFCELSGAACGRFRPRRLFFPLAAGCALSLLAAADFCTPSGAPWACCLLAAAAAEWAMGRRVLTCR